MATLPVRAMVLHKHGVGFFVREGSVTGNSAALTFRQEEINDVLKSLAVFDRSGGHILGIHYQTPMDKAARLASSSIRLGETSSLRDLITRLRGRRAVLDFEPAPGATTTMVGRVIGLDDPPTQPRGLLSTTDHLGDALVSILADDGLVRAFRLGTLRGLRILDTQSEYDLTYFLDTSLSEDARRTVNLRLNEGAHDLVVYYVAPSPTWRVSYRLVAESDEGGTSGKALLQGWGLFDNRLDEDLEDVGVTLVAGQPISFIYDLYTSRIPVRPTVKDEARIAPGPVEYLEMAALTDEEEPPTRMLMSKSAAPAELTFGGRGGERRKRVSGDDLPLDAAMDLNALRSTPPAAEGKDAGEFFQYVVTTPVSVKRGESALVPILTAEVSYERELLYNGAKLPTHPVMALRFTNSTGLTFERGPVTVVEDGDYKGEAVVAFTKTGNGVYLPFAVELGIRVTERETHDQQTTGLSIQKALFVFETYLTLLKTYTIENTTDKPATVTIEAPIMDGWEVYETRAPDVETATERRWRVTVSERSRMTLRTQYRYRTQRTEAVRSLDQRKLQEFLKNRWLDDAILGHLGAMLDEMGRIQQAKTTLEQLAAERKALYERQEQLRANLTTLQATGEEAALRTRMLAQLSASQDRLEAIEREGVALAQQIAAGEARVSAIVEALG